MYPILFKLGPLTIRSYGLGIALAFLVGLYLARREAKRKGIDEEKIVNFSLYVLIAGVIGARLYYIAFYDSGNYLRYPAKIFFIWEGGLAIHGGIIGGLLTAIWLAKRQRISFWKLSDTLAPSLIIGQAIGRIGCFFNGCGYGVPTRLPWGVVFPEGSPGIFEYGSQPLHPTQLYEMLLNFGVFVFIWKWRNKGNYDGYLFLVYIILYSGLRFFVEIFRGDSLYVWGTSLKAAQAVGVLTIIVSLLVMRFLRKQTS